MEIIDVGAYEEELNNDDKHDGHDNGNGNDDYESEYNDDENHAAQSEICEKVEEGKRPM